MRGKLALSGFLAFLVVLRPCVARAQVIAGIVIGAGELVLGSAAVSRLYEPHRQAESGAPVQVHAETPNGSHDVLGKLVSVTGDSVLLASDSGRIALSRKVARTMDIDAGMERKWAQGWGIGLVSGATTFGVLGLLSKSSGHTSCDIVCPTSNEQTAGFALVAATFGAAVGAPIGALIGAGFQDTHWIRAANLDEARVSLVPLVPLVSGSRTAGLALHISY